MGVLAMVLMVPFMMSGDDEVDTADAPDEADPNETPVPEEGPELIDLTGDDPEVDEPEVDGPEVDDPEADEPADVEPSVAFAGDDTIQGTEERDTLIGFTGSDLINGAGGNDIIDGDGSYIQPQTLAEDGTPIPDVGNDTLLGGAGNDLIRGHYGDDLLLGEDGDDNLGGNDGNDTIVGGLGNDLLIGEQGDDSLDGGTGDDTLRGGRGLNTLIGGDGNDLIDGGTRLSGISSIDAGAGDDTVVFGEGSTVTGGSGADDLTLLADVSTGLVAQITDFDASVDTLEVEVVAGNANSGVYNLQVWEDGTGSTLRIGEDAIVEITGGQNLTLADIMDVDGTIRISAGGAEGPGFEGTAGDDTLIAVRSGEAIIRGGDGDDIVDVGQVSNQRFGYEAGFSHGSNLAEGGDGNDTLLASGGEVDGPYVEQSTDADGTFSEYLVAFQELHQDTLVGGAGDDVLAARNGAVMTGGEGADTFALAHSFGVSEIDVETPALVEFPPAEITDFDPAEDVIALDRLDFLAPQTDPPQSISEITINPWDDGTGSDVLVDGYVVARVTGGQDLQVSDIRLFWLFSEVMP